MFYNQGQFNIKQSWDNNEDKPKSNNDLDAKNLPTNDKAKKKDPNDVLDILDNEIARRILKDFKDEGGFKKKENPIIQPKGLLQQAGKPITTPTAKGNDLLATMAARLSKLESTCNSQREEIKEKTKTIDKLQSEINILKTENNAESLLKLKEENENYKNLVHEMEKFLNDYGLKWVGSTAKEQNRNEFNAEGLKKDIDKSKPIYKSKLPREIDINVVERRIEELNIIIANEGDSEIVKQKNGAHVFKKKEPIHIAFYKDGLIIQGYPFYKYSSREALQIIEDILDGYFPALLKHKYPEGTLFKLVVKVEEDFATSIANSNKVNDINNIEDRIFKPLSKEAFLNELPREVIKNGKIIPIREGIAQKIGHPSIKTTPDANDQTGVVEIPTSTSEKEKKNTLTPEQAKQVITLKIRTESGKRTLTLKVLFTDKISLIYKLIKDFSETKNFEIWGGYPPQAYSNDDKASLEDLEIFSDSAFNLRAL